MEKLPTPTQPAWSTPPEEGYSYVGTYWVPNEDGIMKGSLIDLAWTATEVGERWESNLSLGFALSHYGSFYDVYMVIDKYSNLPYLTVRFGDDPSRCWNGIGLDALTVNLPKTPQYCQVVRDVFKRILKELMSQNGGKEICISL